MYQSNAFDDLIDYREILLQNVVMGMQELLKFRDKLENSLPVSEENFKHMRTVEGLIGVDLHWETKLTEKLQALWADQVCFIHKESRQL